MKSFSDFIAEQPGSFDHAARQKGAWSVSGGFKFGSGSGQNKHISLNLGTGNSTTKIAGMSRTRSSGGTSPESAVSSALNRFNSSDKSWMDDWAAKEVAKERDFQAKHVSGGSSGITNSSTGNKQNIRSTGGVSKNSTTTAKKNLAKLAMQNSSVEYDDEKTISERKGPLTRTLRKLKTGRLKDPLAGKTKELLDAGKKFNDEYTKKYKKEENELEKRAKANEKARKWLKKDAKKSGYTDIALRASMSKGAGVSEATRYKKETGYKKGGRGKPSGALAKVLGDITAKYGKGAVVGQGGSRQDKKVKGAKSSDEGKYMKRLKAKKELASKAKKAGFKSTQGYVDTMARYGGEDNYKKGKGLGT